ncbi:MAG: hypothetical protein HQK60_03260 [Deltaproteobacteria bacterium]|nr:hypothetical protein [Deltaproteobacteria bacterium]
MPERLKVDVKAKADIIVESILKPQYIKPAPQNTDWNYLVDIFTKWYRSYFYFCGKYCSPGPNAMVPYFETRFARMEYTGNDCFSLAYMRHTEQWFEIQAGLSIDESLARIKIDPLLQP